MVLLAAVLDAEVGDLPGGEQEAVLATVRHLAELLVLAQSTDLGVEVIVEAASGLRKRQVSSGGLNEVVPLAVELVELQVDGGQLGI